MRAGHTFYTHTAGYRELREAIAGKVFELHRVRYDVPEIMATVGATMAIYAAIRAFVGRGDNAVIVSPAYAIFSNAVIMSGGEPRPAPLARDGNRFVLDLDRVRAAIDANTRMLDRQQPVEPDRLGDHRRRAARARGDRRAPRSRDPGRRSLRAAASYDGRARSRRPSRASSPTAIA